MTRRTIIAVPAACFAGAAFVSFGAAESALRGVRSRLPGGSAASAAYIARATAATLADAEIRALDGARLRGWLFRRQAQSGRAVVLLHGIGDTRNGMLSHAQFFLSQGYDVLAPDSRAQGESGGDVVSYGLLEAGDVRSWASWLRRHTGAQCVFGLGESFGAGVLIQAAAGETPFCAVVAESPYASFRDAAYLRVGQVVGRGEATGKAAFPVVGLAMAYTRVRYGLDLGQASPVDAVQRVRIPLLVIHGTADGNIPVEHGRRIVRAARGHVQYWEVPGGGHTDAFARRPAEFARRVLGLFGSVDSNNGA